MTGENENWRVYRRTGKIYQVMGFLTRRGRTWPLLEMRAKLPPQAKTVRADKKWVYFFVPRLWQEDYRREAVTPVQFINKRVALTTGAPPIPLTSGKRRRGGRRSG